MSQVAALKILQNDIPRARAILQYYFTHQYQDQIVASGEQPFEAVRTRPFHYRCFNLEAMIVSMRAFISPFHSLKSSFPCQVNAKLGDYIGLNLWSTKSRYGATIQTAVDFVLKLNPKDEDITEMYPHVAAIAAAYGDPIGRYATALRKSPDSYKQQPYWFYDQPAAFGYSPVAIARRTKPAKRDMTAFSDTDPASKPDDAKPATSTLTNSAAAEQETHIPPFLEPERPPAFQGRDRVELDDGLYVTWEEVKQYFAQQPKGSELSMERSVWEVAGRNGA